MQDNDIRRFWETQAQNYKDSIKAVNFDPLEEELELFFLEKILKDNTKICDLGCGNGRTIKYLSSKIQNSFYLGIDFAENMIKEAIKTNQSQNVVFLNMNATDKNLADYIVSNYGKFDYVITKRLLINIKSHQKRISVIENISKLLKNNGLYIMIECFIEPLNKINEIRKSLGLEPIKVKPFNSYLNSTFLNIIEQFFQFREQIDFESTYYFISRIFNAYLTEGTPDYFSPINKLAITLTKLGYNFLKDLSPETIYLFQPK